MRRLWGVALAAALVTGPALAQKAKDADRFRDALSAAAVPYLSKGGGAWDTGGQPNVGGTADSGYTINIANLVYRGGGATAEFGATTLQIRPQPAGYAVQATPTRLKISDGQGVALDARFDRASVHGLWLPERQAFRDLDISLHDVDAQLRGGTRAFVERVSGSFKAEPAGGDKTGAFAGKLTIAELRGTAANGNTSHMQQVALTLNLQHMQQTANLDMGYRHERPVGAAGLARELIPVRLGLDARLAPFPWREALAQLPRLAADLIAAAAGGSPTEALSSIGGVMGQAGGTLQLKSLSANSPTLTASGSGQAKFQTDGKPVGQFTVEIQGIDRRLNTMDRSEQKRYPEVFPVLALMSMLGESEGRGPDKTQRYRLELKPDGGFMLNGRDTAGIKVPK